MHSKIFAIFMIFLMLFSPVVYAEGEEEDNDDSGNDETTTVNAGSISSSIKDIDVAVYKGEAGFSVPIASLPGRGGLGYDLALTYSSDVFNQSNSTNNISQASWVGLGFNLDSGYIYRDYGDEKSGGVDFMIDQSDDSFYLSLPYVGAGKLIEIANSEIELDDGSKKITYKTQSDSFAKVDKIISPNGKYIIKWIITSADGTKYYFDHPRETVVYSLKNLYDGSLTLRMPSTGCYGEGDCSEVINYPAMSGADKLAYRWDLTKIEDINGNLISFKYQDERRVINIQNAKSVAVDYQCYNPEISENWYLDGEQCLKDAYDSCEGRTGQEFINCFTSRVNSVCSNYVNGDGCEQMNGVCLDFDWSCRNATILGPKYFDFGLGDNFDTAYGLFPCGSGLSSGGSCWISTDNQEIIQGDPDSNHKCYNTESGGSDEDHSGNCTAYGGKPILEGGSFFYPAVVNDDFICAQRGEPSGFYIGSLIDPNDGATVTSTKSLVATSEVSQEDPIQSYYRVANLIYSVKTYSDGTQDVSFVGHDDVLLDAFGSSHLPPAVQDVAPFNPITGTYTLAELPGDAHCCAGFGEKKQGDYSVADSNSCTPAALGGIDKVRDYFRLPSATVQCYKKYSNDIYDNQICKGFDLGPGGCNAANGVPDLLLYSCCVGKVINVESPVTSESPRSTRTMGQCLSSVPVTSNGGYVDTCNVNIGYSNSCPESYVATSYLKEIADSSGNRIKFSYGPNDNGGIRDDYNLSNPINVTAQLCPGKESQIFLESEHPTTNQQKYLSEVLVTNTKIGAGQIENQLNKVVFNYDYKTNQDNDPKYYKKLVLESLEFYGQDDNSKLPELTFNYNDMNMVNKVTYPTGGSISFEYVPATFNYKMVEVSPGYYSRYSCQDPISGGCDNIVAYRVDSKTVDDGMGEVYTTTYSYGDGVYHVEGQNPFVGYDSVTVNLPGDYGSTTSFFMNDNYNLVDPLRQVCDDYIIGYDFASGVNNGYYDLFHRMSDVAYKSVSSDFSGNQVSSSASYICPVVTYETDDVDNYKTKAYQSRLMKQENIVDSVKTVVEYTEYNEENGMPEVKLSTNSDGSVLKEVTSYAFAMPVGESNVHTIMEERNMLNHVFNQVLIDDSNEERLSYIYTNYRFYDENGESVDYCNECSYPIHPYKVSTWIEDTNNNGNPDPSTDEFISVLFTKYDSYGNLLETLDPSGERSITYYGDSAICSNDGAQLYHALPTCQENALGQRTRIGYDNLNRISEVIDANDLYIHYTYDGLHRLKTAKVGSDNFDSEIYDYHYGLDSCDSLKDDSTGDCMNWVSSQKIIDFTTGLYSESKSFSDGLAMHMRTKTTKDSNTALKVDTTYNAIAKVDKVSEPQSISVSAMEKVLGTLDGQSSSEVVLMYGDKLTSESIGDNSLKYVYTKDPLARVSKVFPLNTYTGDETSDCSTEGMYCTQTEYSGTTDGKYYLQTVSDANGKYVTSKVDKFGRVVEVSDASGGKITNNYDLLGNVVRAVDQEGKVTENVYDVGGRLVSTTTPNSGETSYTYDESGNIKTISDSENRLTLFNYDELNRVVSMSVNGIVLKENSYDVNFDGSSCREQGTSKGLLCEVRYNKYGNSISYLYDIKGRTVQVIESIQGVDYVTIYDYDDAGNVKRITSPNGDYMDYEYNKLNQLANADINSDQQFIFNYNDEGTISSISYPNSLTQSFTYTSRNWVDDISVKNANNDYLFREKYDYDKVGNLNGMAQLVQQSGGLWDSRSVAFSYDDLYRLTSVQDSDYYDVGEFSLDSMSYSYDNVGNRLTKDVAGNTGDVTSDNSYTYYPGTDKLESTNDCTYQYDNVGNMVSKTCGSEFTSYLYDENNMIYRINMANGDILEFEYDALGRRTLKKLTSNGIVSSTLYVYGLGNNPIMTIDS